jgi:hypothetical protein
MSGYSVSKTILFDVSFVTAPKVSHNTPGISVFDITSIVPESEMSAEKIKGWVYLAMKNKDLLDYTITLEGKSSNADGYLGNIIFITVVGKTKGQNKSFNLVVKSSKESSLLRQQTPIKEAFDKEIYIYNTVLPAFRKFQKERTT